jgi:hypothetical protein
MQTPLLERSGGRSFAARKMFLELVSSSREEEEEEGERGLSHLMLCGTVVKKAADDDDIEMGDIGMGLKCPVSGDSNAAIPEREEGH